MGVDGMRVAIGKLPTIAAVEEAAKALWGAVAAGEISDADAEALDGALAARRTAIKGRRALREAVDRKAAQGPSLWSYARREDRARSMGRRRRLAATGPLPPALAAHFTTGELAVLRIVGDVARATGSCDRTLGEMAARAGVGRTTAQNALRHAARLGLLRIEERRRPYQRSLPNVVTIVSAEWRAWMTKGPRNVAERCEGGGFKEMNPTDTDRQKEGIRGVKRGRETSLEPLRRLNRASGGL